MKIGKKTIRKKKKRNLLALTEVFALGGNKCASKARGI